MFKIVAFNEHLRYWVVLYASYSEVHSRVYGVYLFSGDGDLQAL